MDATAHEILARNLRTSLDLNADGFAMKRQQLRLRHPDVDEETIDCHFRAWLRERPGAELGDGVGRPLSWPLTR
jgi:hypothetical protein